MSARVLLVFACAATAATCSGGSDSDPAATIPDAPSVTVTDREATATPTAPAASGLGLLLDQQANIGRVDLQPTGNRVIEGRGAIGSSMPVTVELPTGRSARWLIPTDRHTWSAVLDDGSTIELTIEGRSAVTATTSAPVGTHDPSAGPPFLLDGRLADESTGRDLFTDPLPDTRVVTDGRQLVALAAPTDRYGHGVLGDAIEASSVEVVSDDGSSTTPISVEEPDVIEGVSPLLADVDEDGALDVVLTLSNSETGARLAAYAFDGTPIAETAPIGTGSRWRNLLAIAPTGPNGEVEIIDIRTPHIGGTLQFFRNDGDGTLELVASASGYSTHVIGSRNLDLGIVTDADGDGRLDVLLPSQSRDALAVVTRDDNAEDGASEIGRVALGADLTTNVSALPHGDDGVAYAVGTADGRVIVWPGPASS